MEQYTALPIIYDSLMEDVDYKVWTEYLIYLLECGGLKENTVHSDIQNILELGCGSGNITIELLRKGYEIVGIDSSSEMLEIAREKTVDFGNNIILLQQDIREMDFDIYEIDCVLAVNDTFNYLLEEQELKNAFRFIHQRLKEGGQFLFDISSPYKLSEILGNNTFGESLEQSCYLWENFYDDDSRILTMDINIFIRNDEGSYDRQIETHFQKAHQPEEISRLLEETGFSKIAIFSDFQKEENLQRNFDCSERIFFLCQK